MDDKPAQKGYISLLMLACQQGNIHQIQELLVQPEPGENSASSGIFQVDQTGRSALHYCAEYSRYDCAEFLLSSISEEDAKKFVDIADHEGFTALLITVINGNIQLLGLLIGKGASVNVQDKDQHTPVHWATVCNHYNCLDLLLDHKAEASTPDIHGAYPVHYAAQMSAVSQGASAAVTRPNNADISTTASLNSLQRSATPTNHGFRFLQRLISYGAPINPLDLDRRQPLLWAASSGAADACGLLAKSGANTEQGDKDGLMALHCAASRGHLNCLKLLVEDCGARVDSKDKHDCTPLMYAATLGYIDCIRYLHSKGAEKNRQDRKGRSAAHLAASKGQIESIMELEDLGEDIWLRNLRGDFPLHEAAQAGYIGVLEFLLSRKPDAVNSTNNDGRSCLHIAAMQKDFALCQFLVENKINVNLVMRNTKRQYFTAIDLATAKNNQEMLRYLRANGGQDAVTVTGKAVTRIQKTFQQFSKEKHATEPHLDPNGILEEAFETGAQLNAVDSRRMSLRNGNSFNMGDDLEDELVMLETDASYLPRLPHEVSSGPTDIVSHLAKERHSDYDEIMDSSVLGGPESTFDLKHGFSSLPSGGPSRSKTQPLFSLQPVGKAEGSPEPATSPAGNKSRPSAPKSPFMRTDSRRVITQPSPNTPVLKFFSTENNNGTNDQQRTKTPPASAISRTSTPVFEMSSLALNAEGVVQSKSGSHNSLVRYDTDSGSDDDMKHPQHRSRFMKQLMSQNDMSYASSGPAGKSGHNLGSMSFSRSYNSFLMDPKENSQRPLLSARITQPSPTATELLPPSRSARELKRIDSVTNVKQPASKEMPITLADQKAPEMKSQPEEKVTENISAQTESIVQTLPSASIPSRTTTSTQMTPRTARPIASQDSASSPRSPLTRELETQTEPFLLPIDEVSDSVDWPTSRAISSTSSQGLWSEKSELAATSTEKESSTVAVQTSGPNLAHVGVDAINPPDMKDSAVSARCAVTNDFDTQTTARGSKMDELGGMPRFDSPRGFRNRSSTGDFSPLTINRQMSETDIQTAPRKICMIPERRALSISTQESQTTPRGLVGPKLSQQSGFFTGDSREHKNSSSGDLGSPASGTPVLPDDDTLPDTFVPPVIVERRKSRLRWDETAGIMPDAAMLRGSSRRASFQAEHLMSHKAEHISFQLPSLSGGAINTERPYKTSTSVNEETESETETKENGGEKDTDANDEKEEGNGKKQSEESEEEHHTEMYKKFRPPTPRVRSLKDMDKTGTEKDKAHENPPKEPTVPTAKASEKVRTRSEVPALPGQFDQIALKNLTSTMRRFSTAMNLPSKTNGLPAMPSKFISSFNNTMLDLAPRSVIVKYLDQLDSMTKKGTRYNEPVVLSRLIPKYVKEMESTGKPDPSIREKRNLLTEIRNFSEWGRYLLEQLTNAVAPLEDLLSDGSVIADGSSTFPRIGSTGSKTGSDTLPDIDQSSNASSISTKGSPNLAQNALRASSRNSDSMEALNGSPVIGRVMRRGKSGSPKIIQSTNDKEKETAENKLPALSTALPIRHPFPWR